MGLARLYTRGTQGVHSPEVIVEVHVAHGLPSFSIVGLPDIEVKESRDRVRSAIQMSGFEFPARRITVNLAPADLPKDSSRFDLPIALGVLFAGGVVKPKLTLNKFEFAGELALDGGLRRIKGALAIAYNACESGRSFILPRTNAAEAMLVSGVTIYSVDNLYQVVEHLAGNNELLPEEHVELININYDNALDLNQVKGHLSVKRALEVAASGRHSLLMVGNPGCGKSMLAERLVTILPALDKNQAIEAASIYSLANGAFDVKSFGKVPFRQPHHSSSAIAIIGGGANPRPGEISLAHNGVLFLDELAEFERRVIEILREPLETKKIYLSRARQKVEFPADFQLVAAMNPCPCGNKGHPHKICRCSIEQISRYEAKLSGPFLDRIDLIIQMPYFKTGELSDFPQGEDSTIVRERVVKTRKLQLQRQNKLNYALSNQEIDQYCILEPKAKELLLKVSEKIGASARVYYKLLKIARTIADMDDKEVIESVHIAQSVQYRKLF